MTDHSGKAIVEFLDYTAKNGLMNNATAGSLSSAVRKVLDTTNPDGSWEEVNLKDADLDDIADRFEMLSRTKYKPDSLQVYKSRFKNAVKMYTEWLSNPSGWRYKAERPASQRNKSKQASPPHQAAPQQLAPAPSYVPPPPDNEMISYPYPLRPGMIVQINLPPDLRGQEAKRLAAFIESLVAEEQLALSAGRPVEPVTAP